MTGRLGTSSWSASVCSGGHFAKFAGRVFVVRSVSVWNNFC